MDEKYQEARLASLQSNSSSALGHLFTGVKGLGFGIVGGVTSILTQTYDGAKKGGVEVINLLLLSLYGLCNAYLTIHCLS